MTFRSIRRAVTAGALALAALATGAGSAQADVQKTLEYTCKYPLVDKQPLTIDITSNIPAKAQVNVLQPAFEIDAVATAKGNTSQAITTLNAQAIDGVSQATASLHFPSGFVQEDLLVDLTVDKWNRPAGPVPNPLVLAAKGETPAVVLDEVGETDVVLDAIALSLRALKADGSPINVKKLTSDFDGNPVLEDLTPEDFNVYCKLNPGESNVIATICVVDPGGSCGQTDTVAPTAPGNPSAVIGCGPDVTVRWSPSTDSGGSGLKGYLVEWDERSVEVPAGTTSYTFKDAGASGNPDIYVSAIDNAGYRSARVPVSIAVADCAPTKVTGLKAGQVTGTSVALSWDASSDPDTVINEYNVYRSGSKVGTTAGLAYTDSGLTPLTTYTYAVEAVDAKGLAGGKSDALSVTTKSSGDTTPPSTPALGRVSGDHCSLTRTIEWSPSTDAGGSGLKGYVITFGGKEIVVPPEATSYELPNIAPTFELTMVAVDNAGNESEAADRSIDPEPSICTPRQVTELTAGPVTPTSVTLSWQAPPDIYKNLKYFVSVNGVRAHATPVSGFTYTATGLAPSTQYRLTVEAVEGGGASSRPSPELILTTSPANPADCPDGLACLDYGLKGSTSLKTVTRGNLPLVGGIKAQADLATGDFSADLTLNNTSGRLVAGGFLPITAKVGFVPVGKTTGKLLDATATKPAAIETNSKVRIKVLEVKLFGAIPLAGGNNCQTRQVSDIALKSTNAFDPFGGGSIAGTYRISDLNGCGPLNGLVSPLTAGGGNTIALDLVKKP